jgi:hypothetical protein
MQHPFTRLWRAMPDTSRRTRRLWVVLAFTGYPLLNIGYATLVVPGRIPSTIWAPIAIILFTATLAGVVAIYGFARDRASMTADLDERQQRVRDQAWIAAYGALTAVVVLVLLLLAVLASTSGPVSIGMDVLTPVGIALGLYLPILPAATLAWSEPEEPREDADDPRRATAGTGGR